MAIAVFEWWNAIPWVLIIIGWLIINHQHNARETRKERRDQLDRLISQLAELEKKAIAFHTASKHDDYPQRELTRNISKIWPQIKQLGLLENSNDIKQIVSDIRKEITLKNADRSTFKPQSINDLDGISDSIGVLVDKLNAAYIRKYHRTFSMRILDWMTSVLPKTGSP